ncbi:MAG: 1-acyl-sn-glycerol-3-phosphate acyltransferase [Sphingobacteriales bacterium]|nr:1-acyl-sn-glycerol-3-phosphate acyltransferase [Sphingobacteriales bacterium]
MLYQYLKIIAGIAIRIYCRRIVINKPELLREKGPLLLACNHPNSFLDSIILDTLMKQPVWSLARGDVFKKPVYRKGLAALRILPVYRSSEGVENLSENYKTFEACLELFRRNGIITIYSEGKCINEWHLRPLKKGTARLAVKAWEENIPLRILPVALNYSSFTRFGKNLFINFGEPITADVIAGHAADGMRNLEFNNRLRYELEKGVYEIPASDKNQLKEKLSVPVPAVMKVLLFFPGWLGWLINLAPFLVARRNAIRRPKEPGHYDALVMGILLLIYPVYVLLITLLLLFFTHSNWSFCFPLLALFTAWAYVQVKPQFEK